MTAARLLSRLFQPVLTSTYLLAWVSLTHTASLLDGLAWFLALAGLSAGIPALFVLRLIGRGNVTDFQIRLREQRLLPLLAALACCAVALIASLVLRAPRELILTLAAGLLPGVLLTLVTRHWQISFHTATLAGALIVMLHLAGPWALLGLPALAAVGWSRVKLGRHTTAQVVAGALVGAAGAAIVVLGAQVVGI